MNALFKKLVLITALTSLSFLVSAEANAASPVDAARSIPIQHNGRVKSFDAFSREIVSEIAGKETWDHKPAILALLQALGKRDAIADIPWIRVDYRELATALGLASGKNFFSYNEILSSPAAQDKLVALARSCGAKRDADIRPSKLEQKAESLYGHIIEVKQLMSGETIRVIPPTEGNEWLSPYTTEGSSTNQFKGLIQLFGEGKYEEFKRGSQNWVAKIHEITGHKYEKKIAFEVAYLNLRPFQWAWVFYLLSFIFLSLLKHRRAWRSLGILTLAAAIFSHSLGLVLRVLILSRPPVSNMYESMVYMNWVLIIAAVLFSIIRKNLTAAPVGALISAIIMIYGNLLPIDTSLEVLVPVLRSNYWLTIHVLTIVSSYGIFALAMGLGHRHLVLDLRGKLSKAEEERSAQTINRVIQIGVLLLGMGTVLGGVWANESWGRFWGWDPKETWALITFLGYLVVVHLKYAKVITPFALALSAVLGFLLVLMTWYGVNFVLGRGLHSYGQGSGGMGWVILYLVLEGLFVIFVLFKRSLKK